MWCWKDGEFVQAEDLRISPLDHGFLYGLGFFETFRTYNDEPFLFEEHMERMKTALNEYKIKMPYSNDELMEVIRTLNAKSGNQDGYFRLNVSAGNEGLGLQARTYDHPTVIIFRKELLAGILEKEAIWLETRRNTPEQAIRYKSHHYANNILARQEVASLKDVEGFFLTEEGFIAEGITSNIFWVKDGELYTPSIETGILNGITRQYVMKLADQLNLQVNEGVFLKKSLQHAEECFVTTSIQEIVPIHSIGELRFAGGEGLVYQSLHALYKEMRE